MFLTKDLFKMAYFLSEDNTMNGKNTYHGLWLYD